jgi:hypothetical protein
VPVSAAVAVAAGFVLAAVRVALTEAVLAGANRTVTVQDPPGARLAPVQVSALAVNAAAPAKVTVSAPVACPPELASVNV